MRKNKKGKLIYFSPAEWNAVQRRAAKLNMRTGTYIRRIAAYGEIKWYDFKKYDTLLISINTIGRNIDQVLKVINSTKEVYKNDVEELKEQVNVLKNLFNAYFEEPIKFDLIE